MLTIRDYEGTEYPLLAVKKHKSELNGTDDLSLTVHQQSNNSLDLKQIDKLWEIEYENIEYKIIHIKRQTRGNSFYLEIRAKPLFYWDFEKQIIHENHDGSHTANSAFRTVFENSGYNFVLVDFSPSVEIEGFGKGSSRLDLFKRLLDRYNYEFYISGSTVYMRHLIGNDTNFMYKYKLNASNISENIDADGMFTHIKGFGNFEDGEEDYFNNAQLKREYTSPLADIVGHYEGPPIVDGRMTQQSTLDEAMKKAVDDSLQISVEGTLHDIRKMGYDIAVPLKGDRVWLMDERIDLEQEIRLHTITTTKDEKDNIIACDVTFGSQSIRERHKANINTLSQNFRDLLTGNLKLPVISLEKIGMDMINAIHAASSEIVFGDFGMQAISKTNPNHVFGLNSEGWYISQDGGRTPRTIATAQGIYADAIFAGTLWLTNDLNIEGIDGYLNISAQRFTMRNHNGTSSTVIEPGRLQMNQSDFELGGGADMHLLDAGNRIYYQREDGSTTRTSGVGVGNAYNNRFPVVWMGTTGTSSNNFDPIDENYFTGFIANTSARQSSDGIQNSVVGLNFQVRDEAVDFKRGFNFDLTGTTNLSFRGMSTNSYSYMLGQSDAPFTSLFMDGNIHADSDFAIVNRTLGGSPRGWRIRTNYDGNGDAISLYGMNSGAYNYQIGSNRLSSRIQNIYLSNEPNISSDERLKENVTSVESGLDFINALNPVKFNLKLTDADRNQGIKENLTKYGLIAQEVIEALDNCNIDYRKLSLVEEDVHGYLSIRYGEFIPLMMNSLQTLDIKVESNTEKIKRLEQEIKQLKG